MAISKKTSGLGAAGVTPVRAVLSDTKLLERILMELDMTTLLAAAQRVCRQWHAAVRDSLLIQQKLFLEPIDDDIVERQYSPSARSILPGAHAVANPLLSLLFPESKAFFGQPRTQSWLADDMKLPLCPESLQREAFLRSGASWRRMHVQQPPARMLCVLEEEASCTNKSYCLGKRAFLDGVRLGSLYDLAASKSLGIPRHPWHFIFEKPVAHALNATESKSKNDPWSAGVSYIHNYALRWPGGQHSDGDRSEETPVQRAFHQEGADVVFCYEAVYFGGPAYAPNAQTGQHFSKDHEDVPIERRLFARTRWD